MTALLLLTSCTAPVITDIHHPAFNMHRLEYNHFYALLQDREAAKTLFPKGTPAGIVDRLLVVGDVALGHLQDDGVEALGLRAHQIVLLDRDLLLRHHGARTQQQQGTSDNNRPSHWLFSPARRTLTLRPSARFTGLVACP